MNNKELKYLSKPITILIALVVFVAIIGYIGFIQINLIYAKVANLKDIDTVLTSKLEKLQEVESVLTGGVNFVDVALPSKSSIIYGIAQIKKLAGQNSVLVSNIKAGAALLEDSGISKYSITFDAEGNNGDIQKFLASFSKVLPIMSIDKVKIDNSGGSARSTVSLYVYFSDLPDMIPAVTESVDGLSAKDLETINELSTYTLPDFFDPTPTESNVRTDPFN